MFDGRSGRETEKRLGRWGELGRCIFCIVSAAVILPLHADTAGAEQTVPAGMHEPRVSERREKAFRCFNIVPFAYGREKETAAALIEFQRRTGIDEALYSLTLHPEGYPASRKVAFALQSYRALKRELAGTEVKLGALLQAVLGHWPRVDQEIEPWTRTVNLKGEQVRFCPLDPRFEKYIREMVTQLAREAPCFVMGDDDIRSFSPLAECFCPLHTAEFNRRTGRHFTPEQYREAVKGSSVGDEIDTAYERLRQDTVLKVGRYIRESLDSVDPKIESGSCMPYWEKRFNGDLSRALASRTMPRPIMRIANSAYQEGSPKTLPGNIITTQAMRMLWPDHFLLDEADTCPHNLYSRSAHSMHAKLCSSIFSGLNGAKLWYVNCSKNGYPVSRKYTDVLAENAGWYQTLAETVRHARLEGIVIPCYRRRQKWSARSPHEQVWPQRDWGSLMLGVFGIPFRCAMDFEEDAIYALAGEEAVDRLTDGELDQMFRRRMLVDGPAAVALTRRGYAPRMGVKAIRKRFSWNTERFCGTGGVINCPVSDQAPFLEKISDGAVDLTRLYYRAFSGATTYREAAPGSVLFVNAEGGRICVTSLVLQRNLTLLGELRKEWLLQALDWLNGAGKESKGLDWTWATGDPVTLLQRKEAESGATILGIFHLGYDALRDLRLRAAVQPRKVERLTPRGEWKVIPFDWENSVLRLPIAAGCYDCIVLRINADLPSSSGNGNR